MMVWSIVLASALAASLAAFVAALRVVRYLRRVRDSLLRERDIAYNFVHDVGDVLAEGTSPDLNVLLERVLFYAQRTTKAEAGALYMLDPDHVTLRARTISGTFPPIVAGLNADIEDEPSKLQFLRKLVFEQTAKRGQGLVGGVVESAAAVLIKNAEIDYRIPAFKPDFLCVRSILLVPMRFHDQTFGVLVVVNRIDEKPFTDTDQSLLQSLADQAAVSVRHMEQSSALEEKARIDRDLAIAREIQTELLPGVIPTVPGTSMAAFCEPARVIGGDYYDFIEVDDTHLGIVIADVSGKGISGAIVMAICRSILRMRAPGNPSPSGVLRVANSLINSDISEDLFITVLYMVLNTATSELRIARAGHVRPVLCRRQNSGPQHVDSPGIAIGIADDNIFNDAIAETSLTLRPGDTIIAYTDGIIEAMDQDQNEWTYGRFVDTVRGSLENGGDAKDVARTVRQELLEFVGGTPPYDDMTLVVLQMGDRE